MSVRYKNPSASQNHAYLSLLAIMPISHNATQPPRPPLSQPHNYQSSCPYSLLNYALVSRLLRPFGLLIYWEQKKWICSGCLPAYSKIMYRKCHKRWFSNFALLHLLTKHYTTFILFHIPTKCYTTYIHVKLNLNLKFHNIVC